MKFASISALVYGALLFVGGVVGFVKTQSTASIVAGTITSAVMIVSAIAMFKDSACGFWGALITASALALFFGYRFMASQKIMPAGIMLVLSLLMCLLLLYQKTRS